MESLTDQRVEPLGGSLVVIATVIATVQLSLLNHVHQFDATQKNAGAPEGLKPEHWPSATLDCPVNGVELLSR